MRLISRLEKRKKNLKPIVADAGGSNPQINDATLPVLFICRGYAGSFLGEGGLISELPHRASVNRGIGNLSFERLVQFVIPFFICAFFIFFFRLVYFIFIRLYALQHNSSMPECVLNKEKLYSKRIYVYTGCFCFSSNMDF